MVARAVAIGAFDADDGFKHSGRFVDGSNVDKCPLKHQYAGPVAQDAGPFRLKRRTPRRISHDIKQRAAVIQRDLLANLLGKPQRGVCMTLNQSPKRIQ